MKRPSILVLAIASGVLFLGVFFLVAGASPGQAQTDTPTPSPSPTPQVSNADLEVTKQPVNDKEPDDPIQGQCTGNPPPKQLVVGVAEWYCVRAFLKNNGPDLVAAAIVKTVGTVQKPLQISYHCRGDEDAIKVDDIGQNKPCNVTKLGEKSIEVTWTNDHDISISNDPNDPTKNVIEWVEQWDITCLKPTPQGGSEVTFTTTISHKDPVGVDNNPFNNSKSASFTVTCPGPTGTPTPTPTPGPTPRGGTTELVVHSADSSTDAAEGSVSSAVYATIAGSIAAAALALTAGTWYARRRFRQGRIRA